MAMWDGAELALAIAEAVKNGRDLNQAVAGFEKNMYAMSSPVAEESALNLTRFTSENNLAQ
ncbi:hypothetical protein BGZ59_011128, partial [Podila verticillata]